jgi:hypothetical protein
MRARSRRHGDSVHLGHDHQPAGELGNTFKCALHGRLRLRGMNIGKAGQPRHHLVEAGIMLHRARSRADKFRRRSHKRIVFGSLRPGRPAGSCRSSDPSRCLNGKGSLRSTPVISGRPTSILRPRLRVKGRRPLARPCCISMTRLLARFPRRPRDRHRCWLPGGRETNPLSGKSREAGTPPSTPFSAMPSTVRVASPRILICESLKNVSFRTSTPRTARAGPRGRQRWRD